MRPALACLLTLAAAFAVPLPVVADPDGVLPGPVLRALEAHGLSADNLSVLVKRLGDEEALIAHQASVSRNPASTMKLVTTFAALSVLSPGFNWQTEAYLVGDLQRGRLEGDLHLRGTGDPYLTTENFWKLLRGLRAKGLERIDGDLVIDNFYFDVPAEDPGAFDGQPFRSYNVVPNALLVNFKTVRFAFFADPVGKEVRVVPDPLLANLNIDNRLRLGNGYCGGYQRGIAFNVPGGIEADTVVLEGSFPAACEEYGFSRAVMTAEEFALGAFTALWREQGGRFGGGVRLAPAPVDTEPYYVYDSPTLAEIVRSINKFSNNVMTRHLLLTLGAELKGAPGTVENGRAVITEWLSSLGLEIPELAIVNGAGLSRDTRITAAGLGGMLEQAYRSPYMPEFIASLPLAAMDGTLRRRYRNEPLAGHMHLKTGRLDHVAAIAGYVLARSGERYAVVVLHNDQDVHRGYGEDVQDALLRWVFEQ